MSVEKKLQSSIYGDARKMCKEMGTLLNIEIDANVQDIIGELVWKKLLLYGLDLESFCKHGKRSNINMEDVKLLVRRNNMLKEIIEKRCVNSNSSTTASSAAAAGSSTSSSSGGASKRKRNA